jgi:pilus assembly protein CpaE
MMGDDQQDDNILVLRNRVEDPADEGLELPAAGEAIERPEAQVWAFQGVHGGAGVTSMVVQMGFDLSAGDGKKNEELPDVLIIDLDFERGNCCSYLDVPHSMRIDELNAAAGRMDEALAQTFIRKCGENLSIISAEGELGGNDIIDPSALLALLDKVSTLYDYILIDLPQMWRSWTQAIIGASDKFTLVMEPSVPALHRTKHLSVMISNTMKLTTPPLIMLNKFERRSLRHGVTLRDAIQVIGRPDLLTVAIDEDVLRQSINSGQPVGNFKADSRYAKSIREITRGWRSEANNFEDQREERRRA